MIRVVIVFIIIIPIIASATAYIVAVGEGYPANPFKWAQERRRRVERARVVRIRDLEHDLGYTPCSDDECYPCRKRVTMKSPSNDLINAAWENSIRSGNYRSTAPRKA